MKRQIVKSQVLPI